MIEPRQPVYQWGQRVRAAIDLINDGGHPGAAPDAILAPAGAVGEVVNIGHATEANLPIYLVEFPGEVVVGCLQDELEPV